MGVAEFASDLAGRFVAELSSLCSMVLSATVRANSETKGGEAMKRTLVVATLGVLMAASCSSGSSGDNDTDTRDETQVTDTSEAADGASSETEPAAGDEADEQDSVPDEAPTTDPAPEIDLKGEAATAESALLTLGDMASGWTEVPSEDEERGDDETAALRDYVACVGSSGDTMFDFARTTVSTGDFTSPDDTTIAQTIAVDDISTVEEFMSLFSADGVATCLGDSAQVLFEAALDNPDPDDPPPDDLVVGAVTAGRLNVAAAGDETVAYRLTLPVSTSGFNINIYTDIVATRVGNSLSGLTIQSTITPFDAGELDQFVQLAAARLGGEEAAPPEPVEVTAQPANPRALLFGNTDPQLPDGEPGVVDVVQIGPVPAGESFGVSVPVVVRNNTSVTVTQLEVTGGARSAGALVGSGSSQGFSPAILEPGEVGFGYVYFDSEIPADSELDLTATSNDYSVGETFGSADLTVTEANLIAGEFSDAIVGGVVNNSDVDVTGPHSVTAYCFDGDILVGTTGTFVNGPDPLMPGQAATFSIDLFDETCVTYLVGSSGYLF